MSEKISLDSSDHHHKKTEKQISQSHTLYIILYTTHRPFRVNIMHKVKLYSPISHPYIF